jgi:hypothetical protein
MDVFLTKRKSSKRRLPDDFMLPGMGVEIGSAVWYVGPYKKKVGLNNLLGKVK